MPTFIPFEYPTTLDGQYFALIPQHRVLFYRREQLGLTQQQVADMANVPLRQYQRIEQGDSKLEGNRFKSGLAICAALMLDPYTLILPNPSQADAKNIKPVPSLDFSIPTLDKAKKVGRKPIMRDVMNVYVNHPCFSLLIPAEVLSAVGSPACIQILRKEEDRRIVLRPIWEGANEAINAGEAYDVPEAIYDGRVLAFPGENLITHAKEDLKWDDELYCVKCRLVKDYEGNVVILIDLNTAEPSDPIQCEYMFPSCLEDMDEDEN